MFDRLVSEGRVLFGPRAFVNTVLGLAILPGLVAVVALLVAVTLPVTLPAGGYYAARHYSACARRLCPPRPAPVAAYAADQSARYALALPV